MKRAEPQASLKIGLPPDALAAVFPFHIALDGRLSVLQAGRSLSRICPDLQIGASVHGVFRLVRPEGRLESDWIRQNTHHFFLLEHEATKLQLRGGFIFQPEMDALLFLGSPWFTDTSDIDRFGLGFEDFATHDPVVDLLQVFQASKVALSDGKKLAAKLTAQRAELREANDRLRSQEEKSRNLALIAARTDNGVVLTDVAGATIWVNEGFTRITGYTLEEVLGRKPGCVLQGAGTDPVTVERMRSKIRVGEGFSEKILNYRKDGRSYWLAIEVQPIHDDEGRLTNFMAIERDVTVEVASQQRLAVQFEVSRVLAEVDDLETAAPKLLRAICENLGWLAGLLWTKENKHEGAVGVWHPASLDSWGFIRACGAAEACNESRLPGRVWGSGQAAWIKDVAKEVDFQNCAAPGFEKVRGAFAFPIRIRGEVWGVVECFGERMEEPDQAMLSTFAEVGNQISQFVVRREAEKALLKTNALQQAILEGANYAIISTSPQGLIQTFNSAAERMLQYEGREVVGRLTPAIFHDPVQVAERAAELTRELGRNVEPGFEVFVAKTALGKPDEREWIYVRKDGSRFPVLLSVTALFDAQGVLTGYLGVGSDITERKLAESDLVKARDAAEAANRAKSDFLAMMSHEIRTPMNAVLGMTNLLLETGLDEQQRYFAKTAARSGESLIEIINDILDFSKIEASGEQFQLEAEIFNIQQIVEDVVHLFMPKSKAGGLTLSAEFTAGIPCGLKGDAGRLRQVLMNLVSNALKFTSQGGATIRVKALQQVANSVRLRVEVEDTGIGMTAEDLGRLFQPFTQVSSSSSRRHGGTGLGLAISKRIVALMGGIINVESTVGKGSLFWFELTLETTPVDNRAHDLGKDSANKIEGVAQASHQGRRILVAEDHDVNRRLVKFMLDRLGCRVDFAGNGTEAVEAWERSSHDIILMDCQMPEMDGFEATKEIRRRESDRHTDSSNRVHIIALTANALKGDREKCLAAGMDGYISKPFTANQLAAALGGALPRPTSSSLAPLRAEPTAEPSFQSEHPEKLCSELGLESVQLIMKEFIQELPDKIRELEALAALGRMSELARLAHSMQGIGFSVGLNSLSRTMESIEKAVSLNDATAVADLIQTLPTQMSCGVRALQDWMKTRRP